MHSSFCFIVNTLANRGKAAHLFKGQIEFIKHNFPDARFIYIKEKDPIEEHVQWAAKHHKYVVAAGGDGTVQQVAKALISTRATLGVLPLGSGNDFAKSLGLTSQLETDLQVLHQRKTVSVDVIKTNSGYFLNTFGIGLDGLTNYYSSKSSLKTAVTRYFVSALKALFRSGKFDYECIIDGEKAAGKSWMIIVANGAVEGGRYEISPESDNTDGVCEVVIVRDISVQRLLVEFLKLSVGLPFSEKVVLKKRFKSSVSIALDSSIYAHADGEIVEPTDHFSFRIEKQALRVIVSG
ncbi:YegS/Rv2252/BmrU family lipid kinase [Aliifodinibius sp. S!AR15-10]|uniref:diacylglycerol/lipid kinase family protein n=1 Tax=Aliifodinibius sp. S!AR15-10 TaxID=2950437 RepID=UPI0028572ACA|nr:YegS/Rv2252/BmrU family lipid kinase [Aliifodinibius sp. S!AR15-10]MDR8392993.1 YegS/Rv2252/BmrU family lipid kinase [Aliifodinibius sp. S!AR15-10]